MSPVRTILNMTVHLRPFRLPSSVPLAPGGLALGGGDDEGRGALDLLQRRVPPHAEPQRAERKLHRHAHRRQDRRDLLLPARVALRPKRVALDQSFPRPSQASGLTAAEAEAAT